MKAYCCQFEIAWEDKPENFRKVRALLAAARPEPGSLFVLQEMFSTGFSMNVAGIAEEISPGAEEFVREIATEHQLYVVAGIVRRTQERRGLNQAIVISPQGEELTRYSKIHPFTLGGESANYARGTRIEFFDWQGMKVAPFICYDLRFPEVFRSAAAGNGERAEMFVVIAAWPNRREQHWVTLLQARAIENQAYVVGVNQTGKDPQFVYPGRSMVVDPHGKILVDAGAAVGIISAEVNPLEARNWRRDFPALADMHWAGRAG